MTKNTLLQEKCISSVKDFYNDGRGLRSVALKNYTSGDGTNKGMEDLIQSLVYMVADDLNISSDRLKINQDYFKPDNIEEQDPQRMDLHVWVDDKVALVIESRAWVDKPFYTLKRAVVRNFMELSYVRRQLHEEVQFILVALALDIKERLVNTMDLVQGYGDRMHSIKLSPHRRGYKGGNYFDHGVNEEGIKSFISLLTQNFAKYVREDA